MAKLKWIGGIAALLGSAMISIHVCRRVKNARKNDEYGNEFEISNNATVCAGINFRKTIHERTDIPLLIISSLVAIGYWLRQKGILTLGHRYENKDQEDGQIDEETDLVNFSEEALFTRVCRKSLDISCNGLARIPKSLTCDKLRDLMKLDLSFNKLKNVPESINSLTNLEHLDISGNNISILPLYLNDQINLRTLKAAHNHINDISELNIPNLHHLDLKGNQILYLPKNVLNMKDLRFIDMSYNSIQSIDSDLQPHVVCNTNCACGYESDDIELREKHLSILFQPGYRKWSFIGTRDKVLHSLFIHTSDELVGSTTSSYASVFELGFIGIYKINTGLKGIAYDCIKDLIIRNPFDIIILSQLKLKECDQVLELCKMYRKKANVFILQTLDDSDNETINPSLPKCENLSEIESLRYVENSIRQLEQFPNETPLLEKMIHRAYFEKRAQLKNGMAFDVLYFKEDEYVQDLQRLFRCIQSQKEGSTHNPVEINNKDVVHIQSAVSRRRARLNSDSCLDSGYSSPRSSYNEPDINKWNPMIVMEIWCMHEQSDGILRADLSKIIPELVQATSGCFHGEGFRIVVKRPALTGNVIQVSFEGDDVYSLWEKFSLVKQYHVQQFPKACVWILCPKCIANNMESPCRRIPAEVSEFDFIHRKSHAFCLATTPLRIIETPLILPKDPKSGQSVDTQRKTRPSFEGRIVLSSGLRRKRIQQNPKWDNGLRAIINRHSSWLFEKHSNLNVISASPVRSTKGGKILIEETCIVLYCSMKGEIPSGEDHFPAFLEGIKTDVWEDHCQLTQPGDAEAMQPLHTATWYHDPLVVGGSIGREDTDRKYAAGTLGGFVQDKNNPGIKGFLTCCHVLFKDGKPSSRLQSCFSKHLSKDGHEAGGARADYDEDPSWEKVELLSPPNSNVPSRYLVPNIGDAVIQPSHKHIKSYERRFKDKEFHKNDMVCGMVLRRLFQNVEINRQNHFIDAAFVAVTGREIVNGELVELDDEAIDKVESLIRRTELSLNFNSAEAVTPDLQVNSVDLNRRNNSVFKCGCRTGLTHGELIFDGLAMRKVAHDIYIETQNILQIDDFIVNEDTMSRGEAEDEVFGQPGDSGSLVFYLTTQGDVKVIGMYFAQLSSTKAHLALPINPVLESLNLELCQFNNGE